MKSPYYTKHKHEDYYAVRALNCNLNIHPLSLTWNLKSNPRKRGFLLETIIFRFHVKLWGCIVISIYLTSPYISPYIKQGNWKIYQRQATCEVQALRERCEMLESDLKSYWAKIVVLLIMLMLMLMDNGWILLGICKKHVCCFQFPNNFHFGWRPQCYVFVCICFVLFFQYCWWKKSPKTTLWFFCYLVNNGKNYRINWLAGYLNHQQHE